MVIIEKGLQSRVDIIAAQTRLADSPYYRINPSGRVPYLIRDDGVGLEESAAICAYLDQLDGQPVFNLHAPNPSFMPLFVRPAGELRRRLDGPAVRVRGWCAGR